jgi:hypothetical protein
MFYVQHQFEGTFWAHEEGWTFHEAALHGNSHCRASYAGSPPISACTTFTAAASRITGCQKCCAITCSSLPSVDLRGSRASVV